MQQNNSLVQHTAQFEAIQEQLGQILTSAGLRHRGSVASLSPVASFALGLSQHQESAWRELCIDFHGNGVTPAMIKAKRNEIIQLFRTATVVSLGQDRWMEIRKNAAERYSYRQLQTKKSTFDGNTVMLTTTETGATTVDAGNQDSSDDECRLLPAVVF